MSGLAFNAMWTAPPPPSYTDTVGIDPSDYVVLTTSRGDEALVHKGCLVESPVLRFCFRKRVPLKTEEVTVEFSTTTPADSTAAAAAADQTNSATSSFVHNRPSLPTAETLTSKPHSPELDANVNAEGGDGAAGGPRESVAAERTEASAPSPHASRHPVTLTESLCTDNSVRIVFPRLNRAQLEVVVSYLYYKHHYNRRPTEARPPFEMPTSAALEVMRVAKALQC